MRSCLLVLACVATGWIQPLRADQSLHDLIARIDAHVNARLQKEGVQPAELSDDVEFIRRVTLDLAGRIPLSLNSRTTCNRKPAIAKIS